MQKRQKQQKQVKRPMGRPRGKGRRKLSISLTFSHFDRLESAHKRLAIPRSRIVQDALDAYLDASEFPYTPEERRVQVQSAAIAQSEEVIAA